MSIKTYKHLTKTNYAGIATKIKEFRRTAPSTYVDICVCVCVPVAPVAHPFSPDAR